VNRKELLAAAEYVLKRIIVSGTTTGIFGDGNQGGRLTQEIKDGYREKVGEMPRRGIIFWRRNV